jgi:cytochrome c556
VGVAAAALACGAPTACSPYVYTDNVQTLSSTMGAVDSSYQDTTQKIAAEKELINRTIWIRDKTALAPGPGCTIEVRPTTAEPCDLVPTVAITTDVVTANTPGRSVKPTQSVVPATDACESANGVAAPPKAETIETLSPLQRAQLLKELVNYTAALGAITKAQDRSDFDNAAAKASTAVAGLAKLAPPPYSAAAPVVQASSNAALWLVGQDLDYRRLQELRLVTAKACELIHVLASALGAALEEQRGDRLDGLYALLILRTQALNKTRATPHVTDQAYGAAIDDAQAEAAAFQAVRASDPQAAAQALSNAHDALVVAVRNNDGQFITLVTDLQIFAQRADDLAAAAAATGSPPAKKS